MDASLQQQYGLPIGSYYDAGSGYVVDPWGNPLGTPQQFGGVQNNGPAGDWTFPTQGYVETPQGQLQVNMSAPPAPTANIGDFTTGANTLSTYGYVPGGTNYEGVTTTYYNPQNGQLAYWYGDLNPGGGSTTTDSSAAAWHSVNELTPQQGVDSSGNLVTYTPSPSVLQPSAPDNQLMTGIEGAAGVLAGILAPELIGALAAAMPAAESGIAVAEMASAGSGVAASTTAANQAIASAVVKGLSNALTSALGGSTLAQALESGAISAALPSVTQGISAELQNSGFSGDTLTSLTGVAAQTLGGALKGGITGGAQGAEAGALSGAATAGLGEAAGAVGSAAINEFSPPQTLDFMGTEYVVDSEGNFVLNGKGDPMTVDEYTSSNKQAFSTFAQKVGAPFISQDISNLFSSTSSSIAGQAAQAPASSATTSSGTAPKSSASPSTVSTSLSGADSPASLGANASPTLTGQGVYSTPTFNQVGSTLTGSPSSQQGSPGTQALAQALNVGNPASATSDTGSTNETGGNTQAVWNTASLKVKDALGSQENV